MMKITLLKLFVGLMAFCIGVFAVNYYLLSSKFYDVRNSVQVSRQNTQYKERINSVSENGVIGVYFNGFVQTKNGLQASFDLVNHNTKTAYYYAYPRDKGEKAFYTEPDYKIEDIKQPIYYCGIRLKTFRLNSGESVTFYEPGSSLNYYFEAEKKNQIGFNFSFGNPENYRTYWSENIYLPDELKSQIKKEEVEREAEFKRATATPTPKFLY